MVKPAALRRLDCAGLARRMALDGTARELRLRRGVLLSELASAVERTVSAVSLWETGDRTPTGDAAVRYGELLQHWLDQEGAV